jgi:proline iminopeptidase
MTHAGEPRARSRLKKVAAGLAALAAAVVGLALIASLGSYLAAEVPEPIPSTVEHDDSLPSLEIDGVALHVRTFGDPDAPVVIAIHGGPGDDLRMLLPFEPLSDEYFLVLYDQRGSGLSQRVPDDALSYEAMLAELGAVVDHHSPDRPVRLIGHSWGAMLASGYIGQNPDRVLQAVLAEPGFLTAEAAAHFLEGAGTLEPNLALVRALWWAFWESRRLEPVDDDARADYMMLRLLTTDIEGHPLAGYFCDGRLDPEVLVHDRFGTRANMVVQRKAMAEDGTMVAPFADGVDAYPNEVLFLAGACNLVIGGEHKRDHHPPLFPRARLAVIEDAGHVMMGDQPERTNQVIREYFAQANPGDEPAEETDDETGDR